MKKEVDILITHAHVFTLEGEGDGEAAAIWGVVTNAVRRLAR